MTYRAIHYEVFIAELEEIKEENPEAADLIEEIKELAEDQTHEVVDPDNPPIR